MFTKLTGVDSFNKNLSEQQELLQVPFKRLDVPCKWQKKSPRESRGLLAHLHLEAISRAPYGLDKLVL